MKVSSLLKLKSDLHVFFITNKWPPIVLQMK